MKQWLAIVAAAAVIAMVAVHLPSKHAGAVCPFGHGATHRSTVAPTGPRPALGFVLDVSTRDDVTRWASAQGMTCHAEHGGLSCAGAQTSLWFRFDQRTLTGIQTSRRTRTAADVATAFDAAVRPLGETKRQGDLASLSRGALRQAVATVEAPAYRAVIRATNMGDGYVLTESYSN